MERHWQPAYVALLESGALGGQAQSAREHIRSCDLCARYCRGTGSRPWRESSAEPGRTPWFPAMVRITAKRIL